MNITRRNHIVLITAYVICGPVSASNSTKSSPAPSIIYRTCLCVKRNRAFGFKDTADAHSDLVHFREDAYITKANTECGPAGYVIALPLLSQERVKRCLFPTYVRYSENNANEWKCITVVKILFYVYFVKVQNVWRGERMHAKWTGPTN